MSIKIAISLQNLLVLVAEIEIKLINKINLINDQKKFLWIKRIISHVEWMSKNEYR